MEGFNWNVFDEYENNIEENTPIGETIIKAKDDVSERKIRLLGYYNFPKQRMNPESERIAEANKLAPLLEYSIKSLLINEEVDNNLKNIIQSPAVFIFADEKGALCAYYTSKKIARLTNVVYDKDYIRNVKGKYQSWFIPGDVITVLSKTKLKDYLEKETITADSLIQDFNNFLIYANNPLNTNATIKSIGEYEIIAVKDDGDDIVIDKNSIIGLQHNMKEKRLLIVEKKDNYYASLFYQKSQLIDFFSEHINNIPINKYQRGIWHEEMNIFKNILKESNDFIIYSDYINFLIKIRFYLKNIIIELNNKDNVANESYNIGQSLSIIKGKLRSVLRPIDEIFPTNATIKSISCDEIIVITDINENITIKKCNVIGLEWVCEQKRVLITKKKKSYYMNAFKTKDEFINFFSVHIENIPDDKKERNKWNFEMQILFYILHLGLNDYLKNGDAIALKRMVKSYKWHKLNGYVAENCNL